MRRIYYCIINSLEDIWDYEYRGLAIGFILGILITKFIPI